MVQPKNTDAIAKATHRSWEDWVALFDQAGARQKDHTAIATLARELMPETVAQKEWWAQSTAVAYGQYAGLRVPGQTSTGEFQVSTSRTIPGDKDAALKAWVEVVDSRNEFGGVPIEGEASTSHTDKWRYWRVKLADGTRVTVTISDKPGGKASVGLQHSKLDSTESIDYWRPIWKDLLAQI